MSATTFNEADHPRAAGGQFAAKAPSEAPGGLSALGAGDQDHGARTAGAVMGIPCTSVSFTEQRAAPFSRVILHHGDDGPIVTGLVPASDLAELLRAQMPASAVPGSTSERRYLDAHRAPVEDLLKERYGATRLSGPFRDQSVVFEAPVSPDTPLDQVPAALTEHCNPASLKADLAGNTDKLQDELAHAIKAWECQPPHVSSLTGGQMHEDRTGNLHCPDGPAMVRDGKSEYYIHGYRHREDGPAIITATGHQEWWQWGVLHREDGPAVEDRQKRAWYRDGLPHRQDGPAVIHADGAEEWWIDGWRVPAPGPSHPGQGS